MLDHTEVHRVCLQGTFDPHIGGGCHSKHQEEEDEEEALQIVGCHSFDAVQDGAQESPL